MTPIKSSMASHAAYDAANQTLTVRFNNGHAYRFPGVPVNVGETVMGGKSFGEAFNKHVAGKYTGERMAK